MSFLELFILAVGLSMDAFAVSICKGLAAKKAGIAQMCTAGLWFGGFQALMPFIGWLLGSRFRGLIERVDHWVAFGLLVLIGANMMREALSAKEEAGTISDSFSARSMFLLAVATSIDALAVGITFGLLLDTAVQVAAACLFICGVTFCFSAAGIKIGAVFGNRFEKQAECFGGILLILMGTKILLEHLGVIAF